ncbi:hypothetical protein Hanom_Chr16g01424711 [Helianthus anomalus]
MQFIAAINLSPNRSLTSCSAPISLNQLQLITRCWSSSVSFSFSNLSYSGVSSSNFRIG